MSGAHAGRMTPVRVTLVDDDPSLLHALTFALEADGYAVKSYQSGERALLQHDDADCLVVDQRLLDTDGLTLIGRLRAAGLEAPAILITTNPDARCRRAAKAAGISIVEKPLITTELAQRIEDVVRDFRT